MKLEATAIDIRYPGAEAAAVSGRIARDRGRGIRGARRAERQRQDRACCGRCSVCSGLMPARCCSTAARWRRGSRRALAAVVGALPQREEPAFPLTVRETVLLGRWARLGPFAPVTGADDRAVAEALERCDMVGFDRRTIDTLSGGEWQRVRLARALASSPRLLLLDEPTASLDVGHEMELFELLRRLVAEGIGVLVITHQLNLVARYAGRIVLLDRGRVAADGAPADVLQQALVSRVFAWPVAVTPWHDGSPLIIPLRGDERPPSGRASDSSIFRSSGAMMRST